MSPRQDRERQEMLLGTLDMLILRTLRMGAAHGHTIARVIEHTSDEAVSTLDVASGRPLTT